MESFSDRLRRARRSKDWNQAELAVAAGLHSGYISALERGEKTNPSADVVSRLENALGLPSGSLLSSFTPVRPPVVFGADEAFQMPLFGDVPAGAPVGVGDDPSQLWSFNEHLGKPGRYLLRVSGSSMAGDGIHDGDLVVVDPDKSVEAGRVVIAVINGKATVKRLAKRRGNKWELVSSHQDYPPIPLTPNDSIEIAGHVVGLVRLY